MKELTRDDFQYDASKGKVRGVYRVLDTQVFLPVCIINGQKPGQRLLVSAGIHGSEYVSVEAAKRFASSLDPEKVAGQVIILPLVNEQAFYQQQAFVNPLDGKNLNHIFPGHVAGSISEKIVHCLAQDFFLGADFYLDLHGGDLPEEIVPLVYVASHGEPDVIRKAEMMAEVLDVSLAVKSTGQCGAFTYAALCGTPSLLLERGGQGLWREDEVIAYIADLYRVMSALEMYEGKEKLAQKTTWVSGTAYYEAENKGYWYPAFSAGDTFEKGDVLGVLSDLWQEKEKIYTAPFHGCVLYQTTALGVEAGLPLIACGRLAKS